LTFLKMDTYVQEGKEGRNGGGGWKGKEGGPKPGNGGVLDNDGKMLI